MPAKIDLTGQVFGRLTVIYYSQSKRDINTNKSRRFWLCICSCGNRIEATSDMLKSGNTKSCGCLRSDVTTERNTTHARNKRNIVMIEFNGERKLTEEWADQYGISRKTITYRLKIGWSVEDAITTPAYGGYEKGLC